VAWTMLGLIQVLKARTEEDTISMIKTIKTLIVVVILG
jgi:hypothetical protein